MRKLEAAGLGGLVEPPPALLPAGEMALQCWAWCEGWRPDRWPIFDALYPVPDWHLHIELLRVIRHETKR